MTLVASAVTACPERSPSPDGANRESQARECRRHQTGQTVNGGQAMPDAATAGRRRCACQEEPPFRNGGNGERAMLCPSLSPFRNGGNVQRAISCPSLSPFLNGDNEGHATSCQRMLPFI